MTVFSQFPEGIVSDRGDVERCRLGEIDLDQLRGRQCVGRHHHIKGGRCDDKHDEPNAVHHSPAEGTSAKARCNDRDIIFGGADLVRMGWGDEAVTPATTGFERYAKDNAAGSVSCRDGADCAVVGAVRADRAVLSEAGQWPPAGGVERMPRIYFLQHWFNLSDPAVEEALCDSQAMRRLLASTPAFARAGSRPRAGAR
jgi:Transposase domain (DUF772)